MKEVELSSGTVVKVDAVPWMLLFDAMSLYPALKVPDPPLDEIKTKGGVEHPPLLPGNPKYEEWKAEADLIEAERERFQSHAMWDEGIKAWKLKDSKRWETDPPKDYTIPKLLEQVGGFSQYLNNRRIAYIRYVVCQGIPDANAIMQALMEGMPLTATEVDGAVEGFQD